MLLSKRISKLKKDPLPSKKEDMVKTHRKNPKFKYKEIPLLPKLVPSHITYQIYGVNSC